MNLPDPKKLKRSNLFGNGNSALKIANQIEKLIKNI